MTTTKLFKKNLKRVIAEGKSHIVCDRLAGVERRIVLTEAEAEAGKLTFQTMMKEKLWNDPEFDNERGWLFGSTKTNLNIGLVPANLARIRMGINMADWADYKVVI